MGHRIKCIALFTLIVGLLTNFYVSNSRVSSRASELEAQASVPWFQSETNIAEISVENPSEVSTDNCDESIFEFSSENIIESSNENLIESSTDESDEIISKSGEDFDENSTEICYENYMFRTDEDQLMLEQVMYSEGGGYGVSEEVIIANTWIARNKIQQAIDNGDPDPFRSTLNPCAYQGVFDDEYNGWRVISFEEGVITPEYLDNRPIIHEICEGVLNGTIPSPIYDWDCCLSYDYFGFEDGEFFAYDAGVREYFIIGNGIYFPSKCWTDKLTWYCENF